ncbi:hypothetical protein CQA53_04960 [Helicobacter didelphidarum]|uniref:CzcB-like barrel-sandwich hybrid domain-containing protein n=1 Tax=Helicobacter didelphidarum TaxID=2040648 RepID=A0A3D8IMW3_9HELI|nr:efflux RND transporter periplasmic adaptor subunit [Helicobacter didelphidarum]RDU65974.1 hypothetical protein CQA53_04960 [Helicobacter didelphidarum]
MGNRTQKLLFGIFVIAIMLGLSACEKKQEFDAMGIFESDEVLIAAEISGRILDFDIKEGDLVQKGALLGRIDSVQLELKKAKLGVELQNALIEQKRLERLYKANAGTKQNLDNANFRLEGLHKEQDILDDQIQRAEIRTPIDGTILEKYAFNGELSSPNKALFKIADMKRLRLKAYLIDTDLSKVKLGDKVSIFSDYGEGYKEYEGVISWISSEAEFTPKTIMTKDERKNLVYAIKIDVENDGYLKLGSYGEIKLQR